MAENEKLTYETLPTERTCAKDCEYPKVRLLCGEVHRIQNPDAAPEVYDRGDWRLLAYLK